MALSQKGGERYTKWTHVENGHAMTRRIHEMKIQGRDGYMHTVVGKDLPDFVMTSAGIGHKGKHLAEILLGPDNLPPIPKGKPKRWPDLRDAFHMSLGMAFLLVLLRIAAQLAEALP